MHSMFIGINRKSATELWLLIPMNIECIMHLLIMHSMLIVINSQSAAALFLLITINIECIFNY